jgi:hypothetical protein
LRTKELERNQPANERRGSHPEHVSDEGRVDVLSRDVDLPASNHEQHVPVVVVRSSCSRGEASSDCVTQPTFMKRCPIGMPFIMA